MPDLLKLSLMTMRKPTLETYSNYPHNLAWYFETFQIAKPFQKFFTYTMLLRSKV